MTLLKAFDAFVATDGSDKLGIPIAKVRAILRGNDVLYDDWYSYDPEAEVREYDWSEGGELLSWDDDEAGYGSLDTGLFDGKPAYAISFCGSPLNSACSYFLVSR